VAISRLKRNFFAGNSNLANPYAVKTDDITVNITLGITILNVFIK